MAEHVLFRCNKCGQYAQPPLEQAFCFCLGEADWVQGTWYAAGEIITQAVSNTWRCAHTMDVDHLLGENGRYPVDPPVRITAGLWYRARLEGDKGIVEEVVNPND